MTRPDADRDARRVSDAELPSLVGDIATPHGRVLHEDPATGRGSIITNLARDLRDARAENEKLKAALAEALPQQCDGSGWNRCEREVEDERGRIILSYEDVQCEGCRMCHPLLAPVAAVERCVCPSNDPCADYPHCAALAAPPAAPDAPTLP